MYNNKKIRFLSRIIRLTIFIIVAFATSSVAADFTSKYGSSNYDHIESGYYIYENSITVNVGSYSFEIDGTPYSDHSYDFVDKDWVSLKKEQDTWRDPTYTYNLSKKGSYILRGYIWASDRKERHDWFITVVAPPDFPSLKSASNITYNSAKANWYSASDATYYEYEYSKNGLSSSESGSTNNLYVNLYGLDSDTEYDFRLRACNGGVCSNWNETQWSSYNTYYFKTVEQTGSLKITIEPSEARSDGARFNVNGGNWKTSGTTINDLSPSKHTICYKTIDGWDEPDCQDYTVESGKTTYKSDSYIDGDPDVFLLSPKDGSITYNRRPTFEWSGSDAGSGISYYVIDVDDSGSGQREYRDVRSPWNPPRDLTIGDVDWKVQACDKSGQCTWTPEWDLDIHKEKIDTRFETVDSNPSPMIKGEKGILRANLNETEGIDEDLPDKKVIFYRNSKTKTNCLGSAITNSILGKQGDAIIEYNPPNTDNFNLIVVFEGDENYNPAIKEHLIEVVSPPESPTITKVIPNKDEVEVSVNSQDEFRVSIDDPNGLSDIEKVRWELKSGLTIVKTEEDSNCFSSGMLYPCNEEIFGDLSPYTWNTTGNYTLTATVFDKSEPSKNVSISWKVFVGNPCTIAGLNIEKNLSGKSAKVTWEGNGSSLLRYKKSNDSKWSEVEFFVLQKERILEGLTLGIEYTVQVKGLKQSDWIPKSFILENTPPEMRNITLLQRADTNAKIKLSAKDDDQDTLSYIFDFKEQGTSWQNKQPDEYSKINSDEVDLSGLMPDKSYDVRAMAFDETDYSEWYEQLNLIREINALGTITVNLNAVMITGVDKTESVKWKTTEINDWQDSGVPVKLLAGNHTLLFKPIAGFSADSIDVEIKSNESQEISIDYNRLSDLPIASFLDSSGNFWEMWVDLKGNDYGANVSEAEPLYYYNNAKFYKNGIETDPNDEIKDLTYKFIILNNVYDITDFAVPEDVFDEDDKYWRPECSILSPGCMASLLYFTQEDRQELYEEILYSALLSKNTPHLLGEEYVKLSEGKGLLINKLPDNIVKAIDELGATYEIVDEIDGRGDRINKILKIFEENPDFDIKGLDTLGHIKTILGVFNSDNIVLNPYQHVLINQFITQSGIAQQRLQTLKDIWKYARSIDVADPALGLAIEAVEQRLNNETEDYVTALIDEILSIAEDSIVEFFDKRLKDGANILTKVMLLHIDKSLKNSKSLGAIASGIVELISKSYNLVSNSNDVWHTIFLSYHLNSLLGQYQINNTPSHTMYADETEYYKYDSLFESMQIDIRSLLLDIQTEYYNRSLSLVDPNWTKTFDSILDSTVSMMKANQYQLYALYYAGSAIEVGKALGQALSSGYASEKVKKAQQDLQALNEKSISLSKKIDQWIKIITETQSIIVIPPYFSNSGGDFDEPQVIRIIAPNQGAQLRYTLDGSMPTLTYGIQADSSCEVTINKDKELKAIAYKNGVASDVVSATFIIDKGPVVNEVIEDVNVKINADAFEIDLSNIFLDPDGDDISIKLISNTNPDLVSISITGNILTLSFASNKVGNAKITLQGNARNKGIETSFRVFVETLDELLPPVFSVEDGIISESPIEVEISASNGANIRYTLDGSTPTQTIGTQITNGDTITIEQSATLKAIAYKDGFEPSDVATASYTIIAVEDTTPNDFTFTKQNNVPLSFIIESSSITVSGINKLVPISVSNGEYTLNGGAFTSANGNVANGDTVKVRHTSASTYATPTITILNIGGVTGGFETITLNKEKPLLSIVKSGTGSGMVTSSPLGINCGEDCSEEYVKGAEITLTAISDTNSTFIGWSGDSCNGTNDCTMTLDSDTEITALFTDITDGLVAYYPFNGNADDESGNGNDGTVSGATLTKDRFGNPSSAYSFDGNDYISINNDSFLENYSNTSIVAWINYKATDSNVHQVLSSGDYRGGEDPISLQFMNNKPLNYGYEDTIAKLKIKADVSNFNFTFQNDKWYLLTTILSENNDGSVLYIYINDQLVQTINSDQKVCIKYDTPMQAQIGAIHSTQGWIGLLDDIRIYNRALTATEVQTLYNQESVEIFSDNFSNGFDKWIKYGSPEPVIHAEAKGKVDVFDNNGDPNYDSGVISKEPIDFPDTLIIESEVYLDFSDLNGCWAEPSIGLTRESNPSTSSTGFSGGRGISMIIYAFGDACWATPSEKRRHSYFALSVYTEDGTSESPDSYSLLADDYINSWHILKIEVTPDSYVKFYIDNNLLWTSTKKLHSDLRKGKHIFLGQRSSGSAGKAYHDWIKVKKDGIILPTLSIIKPDNSNPIADSSYQIIWQDDNPTGNATISLYYDDDNSGKDGTPIEGAQNIATGDTANSFTWDTSNIPEGSYYIYAIITDGNETASDYSEGTVTIETGTADDTVALLSDKSGTYNIWLGTYNGTTIIYDSQITFLESPHRVTNFKVDNINKRIVYSYSQEGSRINNFKIIDFNGNYIRDITNMPSDGGGSSAFDLSPNCTEMVFSKGMENEGLNIQEGYVVGLDNLNLRKIIPADAVRGVSTHKSCYDWVGEDQIVFANTKVWSDYNGQHDIHIYDNGNFSAWVANTSSGDANPLLSPEGKTLAFSYDKTYNKGAGIGLGSWPSGSQQELVPRPSDNNHMTPRFWLDEQHLIYSSQGDLFVINTNGSGNINLTSTPEYNESAIAVISYEPIPISALLVVDKDSLGPVENEFHKLMEQGDKAVDMIEPSDLKADSAILNQYSTLACFTYGSEAKVQTFDQEVTNIILNWIDNGGVFVTNREAGAGKILKLAGYMDAKTHSGWYPALKDSAFITIITENEDIFKNVVPFTGDPKSQTVSYWDSTDHESLVFRVDNSKSYTNRYGVTGGYDQYISPTRYLATGFSTGFAISDIYNNIPEWRRGKGAIIIVNQLSWTFDQATQSGGYIGIAGRHILQNIAAGLSVKKQIWYKDLDGDKYSDGTNQTSVSRPDGYYLASELTAIEGDCMDDAPDINPGVVEICNSIDDNCNGEIDEGLETKIYYRDADSDGYGNLEDSIESCSKPSGYVLNSTDCDDTDPEVQETPKQTWYRDSDGDKYSDGTSQTSTSRPDGYYLESELTDIQGDCIDDNPDINPGTVEICNSIDDNCNNEIDEGLETKIYYRDADSDGYGNSDDSIESCSKPSGYVLNNTDCDDNDPDVQETCKQSWYKDADGDKYSDGTSQISVSRPEGYYLESELTDIKGDCMDNNSNINPEAAETCNGIDDNCNGQIDEELESCKTQIVSINGPDSASPDDNIKLDVNYDVTDDNNKLSGLGLRIHFDSSKLTWTVFDNVFDNDKLAEDGQPVNDVENYDNDQSTDKYLNIAWASIQGGGWPNSELPVKLYEVEFKIQPDVIEDDTTLIRLSPSDNSTGYTFSGTSHTITFKPQFTWDIDGNGQAKALTDGLLVLRYLFGFRGETLIKGAIDSDAVRGDANKIEEFISQYITICDIDGDGEAKALTDGLLLLRYLFGFRGETLVNIAVGTGAIRGTSIEIEDYIIKYQPSDSSGWNSL